MHIYAYAYVYYNGRHSILPRIGVCSQLNGSRDRSSLLAPYSQILLIFRFQHHVSAQHPQACKCTSITPYLYTCSDEASNATATAIVAPKKRERIRIGYIMPYPLVIIHSGMVKGVIEPLGFFLMGVEQVYND
jgi:hypothetical protein